MAHKDAFLNSLSDEQLGIFYAYEYNDNLDDILQDYITHVQYSLFMEWKNNEAVAPVENAAATNNADLAKLDNLLSVVNNLTTMLGGLCERMDSIESSVTMNQQEVIGKIATLELNQKKQTEQLSVEFSNFKQTLEENRDQLIQNQQDLIGKIATLELNQKNQTEKLSLDISHLKQQLEENQQEDVMKVALRPLEYKAEVKDYLKRILLQIKDSSMKNEMKEETCNKDIIKKILKDMKIYKDDEEIEKNSTEIMWELSCVSHESCMNIIESGILEYLKEIFVSYWPKRSKREAVLTNIFFVFFNISRFPSTRKHLLKDIFFELFMLPLADPNFSNFNIIAGRALANLLCVSDNNWTVTMTKEQADVLLIENIPKWQLGLFNPFTSINLEWRLKQISNGRKSHKLFCSWVMANQLTAEPAKYTELWKKEEQSIKRLEELVAKKSTDAEVRKHLQICLDVLRK